MPVLLVGTTLGEGPTWRDGVLVEGTKNTLLEFRVQSLVILNGVETTENKIEQTYLLE